MPAPLTLRSDHALVFTPRRYTATVRAYDLHQEMIILSMPEQNGAVERFIRPLKEECIWQHRFESISHAREAVTAWVRHYKPSARTRPSAIGLLRRPLPRACKNQGVIIRGHPFTEEEVE